jgi:hypothetical protein
VLVSCKKPTSISSDSDERFPFKREEIGYIKGMVKPWLNGEFHNHKDRVVIWTEDLQLDKPKDNYRINFKSESSQFSKQFLRSEFTIEFQVNLVDVEIGKSYQITNPSNNNIPDLLQNLSQEWIYVRTDYRDYQSQYLNEKANYTITKDPIVVTILGIAEDQHHLIPIVEGTIKGKLFHSNIDNESTELDIRFKSRYYKIN